MGSEMTDYALNQVTKWENLFWHQPYKTEGDRLKAIENNMTKDLIFILTKKECKTIRRNFFNLVKQEFAITQSEVVRKGCQIGIGDLEKKDTYLIFLSKRTQCLTKGKKDPSERSIFDGFIEFEKMNLVFEVKTDSSTDYNQITKYEGELKKGVKYKGHSSFTWDGIYAVMTNSWTHTNNEIEKLLIGQYMELIEVMGLVEDFYGFKGTTPEEHNRELRSLLSKLQRNGLKYDTTKKMDESWIRFSLHELKDEPHFTISRDNAKLELGVTLRRPRKKPFGYAIKRAIDNICKWNENEKGQTEFGRTVVGAVYDYRTLSGSGQKTKQATEFQVIVRLDKNITAKSAERRVDGFLELLNPKKIKEQFEGQNVQLKQIRIGIEWNVLYHKTARRWGEPEFSYKQVKKAFYQLCPLYTAIRGAHRK